MLRVSAPTWQVGHCGQDRRDHGAAHLARTGGPVGVRGRDQEVNMRIGVVGYGTGGQNFHAPFIEAADGVELVGVVARSAERKAAAASDWPGVPVYGSLTHMLAAGVDAVTITTP